MSGVIVPELEAIHNVLVEAAKFDLEAEVILTALEAMKYNPSLEVIEAMNIGLNEWVK